MTEKQLTDAKIEVLNALTDGNWHEGGQWTGYGRVEIVTASILCFEKLVEHAETDQFTFRITPAGRDALARATGAPQAETVNADAKGAVTAESLADERARLWQHRALDAERRIAELVVQLQNAQTHYNILVDRIYAAFDEWETDYSMHSVDHLVERISAALPQRIERASAHADNRLQDAESAVAALQIGERELAVLQRANTRMNRDLDDDFARGDWVGFESIAALDPDTNADFGFLLMHKLIEQGDGADIVAYYRITPDGREALKRAESVQS